MKGCEKGISAAVVACIGVLVVLVFSSSAKGKIREGECSECHTMHNSQDGQPVATDLSGNPVEIAYERLLISSCLGCHSSDSSTTIGQIPIANTPSVNNLAEPTRPLAGGNFYYVALDDASGHNVDSSNPDDVFDFAPPGGDYPTGGSYTGQLRCAGTRGCHGYNGGHGESPGDSQFGALDGAHHEDEGPMDGTTVGRSYRFLFGIVGKEDPDWEHDLDIASHNEYAGATGFSITNTVSFFCGECHGNYHGMAEVGTDSPWFRHPTDTILPVGAGEYSLYNSYSLMAPVARQDPFNVPDASEVTPGNDVVMCLSCHRAHGSPHYKMMRWDYKSPDLATALSGCGVCHTAKN